MSKFKLSKSNRPLSNTNGDNTYLSNSSKNILILMSGSIAAYKTCFLISQLVQKGHEVQVVTTPQALQFIGAATLEGLTGKAVLSETFAPHHAMDHIHLARWADLILLSPATANTLNKMSQGIADDLVTNLFLAHDFTKPFLITPAMNTAMYQHPATQNSMQRLKAMGLKILNTGEGSLACGEVGPGRLLEPELILLEIQKELETLPNNNPNAFNAKPALGVLNQKPNTILSRAGESLLQQHELQSKEANTPLSAMSHPLLPKVLITSGGTQEPIDAMRVLTNLSTGQTGAFLAEAFFDHGFEVHYLGATSALKPQRPCPTFSFTTFNDLNDQLKKLLGQHNYVGVIHAAAVSDFHVSKIRSEDSTTQQDPEIQDTNGKLSSQQKLTIELEPNFKILPLLKSYGSAGEPNISPTIVGFKFTSTPDLTKRATAVQKLFVEGGVDVVIHNDRSQINKYKGLHSYTLHTSTSQKPLPNQLYLAEALVEIFKSTSKTNSQTQESFKL